MIKKYIIYLIRWQLSTPILAIVLAWLSNMNTLVATIIANLIGGLIFFWVDQYIFKKVAKNPLWEIQENAMCSDCGDIGTGYRIVEWYKYDRTNDDSPEFRCDKCRKNKMKEIEKKLINNK